MPAGTGLLSIDRWQESKTAYDNLIHQTTSPSSSINNTEIHREFLRQSQPIASRLLPIESKWSLDRFQTLWQSLSSQFEIQLLEERLLRTSNELNCTKQILTSLSKETIKSFTQKTQTYQSAIEKEREQMTKEEAEEREAAESERVASKELNEVEELLRQCKERVAIQQAARSDEEKQHEETLTILVSNIDETRREILETGRGTGIIFLNGSL